MKWYRINPCPKYAISDDGEQVLNTISMKILHHHTAKYAPDNIRRITLYYLSEFMGKLKTYKKVFTINQLKEYIKEENLIDVDESKIIY